MTAPTQFYSFRGDPTRGYTDHAHYTGNEEYVSIEWILTGGQMGIEPGYVVMAIKPVEDPA